jgi:hypothetical protein
VFLFLIFEEDEDEVEVENYFLKLENGLFALQSIVYIIMAISVESSQVRTRVNKLLNLRSEPKSKLCEIIEG